MTRSRANHRPPGPAQADSPAPVTRPTDGLVPSCYLEGMRSRRRPHLHWLRLVAALGGAIGLGLPGCQFPDYDLPDADGGSGGTGASGGAGAGGSGIVAGMGAAAGDDGEGGAGGEPVTPVSSCATTAQCAPPLLPGWDGPIAFWQGSAPDGFGPDCPDGYRAPLDVHLGLTNIDAGCTCSCAPEGQSCQTMLRVYGDTACSSTECATVPATSNCVAFTGCSGNQGGMRSDNPTPMGGTCKPTVSPAGDLGWKTDARLCLPRYDDPGLCGESGQACAPTPRAPYFTDACVMRVLGEGSADLDCPSDYPRPYGPFYAGYEDKRSCTTCTCGSLTGGACEGVARLTNDSRCLSGETYTLGVPMCTRFQLPEPPTHLRVDYTLTPGTCSVATASHVTGDAVPSGTRYRVCCL
jgi:hypothetical protein